MDNSTFGLTQADEMFRNKVRELVRDTLQPGARTRNASRNFAKAEVDLLAKEGLLGMLAPQQYGGAGSSLLQYCLAIEEIAAVDAGISTTVHVHSIGSTLVLSRSGSSAQKARYLPDLASGRIIGSFLLTEPQAGSDTSAFQTRARKVGDDFLITGEKHLITNGKSAGLVIVWAMTDPDAGRDGMTGFILPTDTPGYDASRMQHKMGQYTSETVAVSLTDCRVSADAVIGAVGQGFRHAMNALEDGRIGIAAQAVGIAQAALDCAVSYSATRTAYGRPIARLQGIAFHLADMATQIEVARTFCWHAARMRDAGVPCLKEASMAKMFASEIAEKVCSAALQVHGGNGYLTDFDVERHARDARVCQIYEGTSDIQRVIIAREVMRAAGHGSSDRTR